MNSGSRMRKSLMLAAGMLCLAFTVSTVAQVQTQTSTTNLPATKEVKIESGEVVAVEGNDLFVRMPDGTLRHFPNVPESATVTVDGKQLGIHELQPGMKLQRTTVRTTTPQVVTTVQAVSGKVWHVTPPLSVILTLENGENQAFKIPEGQKFTVGGQEVDAWGLKKGMEVSATKVVETPVTAVSQHTQVTGTMPAGAPVLIARGASTPAPAGAGAPTPASGAAETTTSTSSQLPKTGSNWPLLGMVGLLSMCVALGSRVLRRTLRIQG